jgi:hypothetical protein
MPTESEVAFTALRSFGCSRFARETIEIACGRDGPVQPCMSPPVLGRTTSTKITGDQGTTGGEVARDGVRRDDARAPKRVKARVISSSLRS